jgi:hypothetical protein
MGETITLEVDDLTNIAALIEKLNEIYRYSVGFVADFDDNEYEILGVKNGELIGKVRIGEDGEFVFAPGQEV